MGFAKEDKIGRKEIVDKICGLVDNLQKDQNFCLALNGEWGSGKTFVMHMIKEELSKHQEYTVIEYDAWENSFYSEPLISILSCIIDSIQEKLSNIEGLEDALKETGKEVLNEFLDSHKKAKFFYDIFKAIKGFVNKINEPFSKDTNSKSIVEFKSYKTLLKEVKEKLNLITTYEEYEGKQNKLIILVDEIDRCLPDDQLKILERLHHLFDIKNCAVICALNKHCIVKNIETTYGVDGEEYLRKFFNFNYALEMKWDDYLENLFKNDLFAKIKKECRIVKIEDSLALIECDVVDINALEKVLGLIEPYIDEKKIKIDNRQINNYYKKVEQVINEFGWDNVNSYWLFFILLGMFIRIFISNNFLEKYDDSFEDAPYKNYLLDYFGAEKRIAFGGHYEYLDDDHDYYDIFDKIANGLLNDNKFSYGINDKSFNGDSTKLKNLMIMYGGQDDTKKTNER